MTILNINTKENHPTFKFYRHNYQNINVSNINTKEIPSNATARAVCPRTEDSSSSLNSTNVRYIWSN